MTPLWSVYTTGAGKNIGPIGGRNNLRCGVRSDVKGYHCHHLKIVEQELLAYQHARSGTAVNWQRFLRDFPQAEGTHDNPLFRAP